jgi:hypothetical protein
VRPILKLPSIIHYAFDPNFMLIGIESIQFKEETMRTKTIVALFTILFLVGTVYADGKANKAEKRAYNYVATFLGALDEGTVTSSGKMVHVRGVINTWFHDASDPRGSGTCWNVLNANVDVTGTGVVWGTWQCGDAAAGSEGTFNGQMNNNFLGESNWIIKFVGHGTGEYEGLKFEGSEAWAPLGYGVGEITNVNKD